MKLGAFSVSLNVKDLATSKEFYQPLGFKPFGGDESQHWLIMKNEQHVIGLFQGMFDNNILTFNPGWDNNAQPLEQFTDVREIQANLLSQGIELMQTADEHTKGPASIMMLDPDGNPVLIDQHV
jgi:predicted lactoylglutathione lyase